MKSPRRIFRSSPAARPLLSRTRLGRALLAWTLGTGAVLALFMVVQSSDLFGRNAAGPDRLQAEPGQVAVVGGDTLRLGSHVVRLAGIEAPRLGDTCGAAASDCGASATRALAALVRDRRVDCRLDGQDSMGRPFGDCRANGTDLSSAVVAGGWARAQPGTRPEAATDASLADLELRARRRGAGLWAATAP